MTLWLVAGTVALILGTFFAFPELRRGSLAAAALANPGLVIGLLEQLLGMVNSNLKEGITFFFILIVLAIRPTGLMGRREITKV